MGFSNYNQVLLKNFQQLATHPAMMFKTAGEYQTITYQQLGDICLEIASALLELGLAHRDRVVILSNNRPEWTFADLGGILAGGITSAIYATNLADEAAYILNDLEARFLFVENQEQLEKILQVRDRLPHLRKVIVFDPPDPWPEVDWLMPFSAFQDLGRHSRPTHQSRIHQVAEQLTPEDIMCIIYTSGTTGKPKGVVLTHGNYLHTIDSLLKHVGKYYLNDVQRNLSFLPLAHALERLAGQFLVFYTGKCLAFAESIDTLMENFKEVRPQLVTAVPRFFEKIYARIQEGLETASPLKRWLFHWALRVGYRVSHLVEAKQPLPWHVAIRHRLANRLIYRKVRQAFGGELVFFVSGGAPLNKEIARFFHALNIIIVEGWGATEATAPATLNTPDDFRFGSVGKPLPGIQVKVAEDGELLIKGPNIFKEYWNLPEETAESFTQDGFYKTGDIGRIDQDGWVYITDRKKQLIITSGGKNIPPAPIEQQLIQSRFIEQAFVHGDNRKYLTALLVPDRAATERQAQQLGLTHLSWEELLHHPEILKVFQQEVDQANQHLARYMQIKKFRLLPEPFTVEKGELTPTLKSKRKVIESRYRSLLDEMYED